MTGRACIWAAAGAAAVVLHLARRAGGGAAAVGNAGKGYKDRLAEKIAAFVAEVGARELSAEKRSVYDVFAGNRTAAEIQISDMIKLYRVFRLEKGNAHYGTEHILIKHYGKGRSGVTADDILEMCEIIKGSAPMGDTRTGNHFYEAVRNGTKYKLVFRWDEKKGTGTLVTFYTKKS